MNIENVKELLLTIKKADYKDLFAALVLNERIDYAQDIEDITANDIEYLEELYDEFLNVDTMTLLNEELLDYLEDKLESEVDE